MVKIPERESPIQIVNRKHLTHYDYQPLYYAFESVMINEFANLSYECSLSDLVPSGPDFTDIANQVCVVVGSEPGQRLVSGMAYIKAQYGFERANLWRNLGINIAIFIFFGLASA